MLARHALKACVGVDNNHGIVRTSVQCGLGLWEVALSEHGVMSSDFIRIVLREISVQR